MSKASMILINLLLQISCMFAAAGVNTKALKHLHGK